jgi:hypothetical protein
VLSMPFACVVGALRLQAIIAISEESEVRL